MTKRPGYLPDTFTLLLAGTVLTASLLPISGQPARWLEAVTDWVIVLLFFLHGSRLSRQAIWAGIGHWRLHLVVLLTTFVFFPVLGWLAQPLWGLALPPSLVQGMLFLCAVPATVQSSIVLTSLGRGNLPAAVCSASGSTLVGIFLTPLLVGVLLSHSGHAGDPLESIGRIALQLLLPFAVGHFLRPWTQGALQRLGNGIRVVDQGSILMVLYSAFSGAVTAGLWQQLPLASLLKLLVVCAALLACSLGWSVWISRRLGFSRADEVAIVFCGGQKSLISGLPMAKVLFSAAAMGPLVLPLLIFHPMQLMVAAALAGRYGSRPGD